MSTMAMYPQQHPFSPGYPCGKDVPCSGPDSFDNKMCPKSASSSETGKGAESKTTSSASGAQAFGDISSAKEAVCFMGYPESLVQLAIDVQRLDHGTDFTDVTQLYLVVDDITQNSVKQVEYARKLHAHAEKEKANTKILDPVHVEVKNKDIPACEEPAECSAEMPKVVSSKQESADKSGELQDRVKMLVKENQKLKKRKMCRACKKVELAASGITFLPCGHFITCEVCSEMFDDCPACGKNIMGTVRTFLS